MFKRAFTLGTILLLFGCADPIDSAKKLLDGVAGGTGEDADIGNWQLKYLDHIANL